MYDYSLLEQKDILCINQKSFFASVSCIEKGLNPLTAKLAVVTDTKRKNAIVLSATPELTKLGIKVGSRLFEIPHRKDIYIINPNMGKYIERSLKIFQIVLRYIPAENLHQCGIDEFFMDVTDSYSRFNLTLMSFCERLIEEILEETNIQCAIGIGPNMLLSKIAAEHEARDSETHIAEWRYADVPSKLWKIEPLRDFWGINQRTEKQLNQRGIFNVGQLAQYPYAYLKRDFGVTGVDLHLHANGIDQNQISHMYQIIEPSICNQQNLMRMHTYEEAKVVMRKLIE